MQTETNENNPMFTMETKPEWTQADGMWLLRSIRATAETGSPVEASFLAKARRNLPCLREVSVEQKRKELLAALQEEYAGMALREYSDIWAEVIPELKTCFGFPQNSPYHPYDVWEHTVHAVEAAPTQDVIVRLALLLHDIGKPLYYQEGNDGIRHFLGHGKISQEVAKRVLERLKFDRTTADAVTQLVGVHDRRVDATPEAVEAFIGEIGPAQYHRFLEIRRCDIEAQKPDLIASRMVKVNKLQQIGQEILGQGRVA